MRLAVVLLGSVTACAGLLDLDPVEPLIDRDRDTVYDELDNCPDVANTDQVDTDHNGVGDACEEACKIGQDLDLDGIDDGCDLCKHGIDTEDEDGDGIADGCDLCPVDPDPVGDQLNQPDADKDGVGDACDFSPDMVARRYFDSFDRDVKVWTAQRPWTLGPSMRTSVESSELELYAVRLDATTSWSVSTEVVLPITPSDHPGDTAGIHLQDPANLLDRVCAMVHVDADWVVQVGKEFQTSKVPTRGKMPFATGTTVRLIMTYTDHYTCTAIAGSSKDPIEDLDTIDKPHYAIKLRASLPTEFHHVDVVAP